MQDLSHPLTDGMQTYPGDPPVEISAARDIETHGYRVTEVGCGSHSGTHVDAPSHTEPDGKSLTEIPIERFVADAVVVDCRDCEARQPIQPDRIPDTEADCVVFHSGWDAHRGSDRYLDHPFLAPEAAALCAERGYDVGIDALSPDPTPSPNARDDEPADFQAHHALLGNGCLIVENLTRLAEVPSRFQLRFYPLPLGTDGAPVRAVGVSGSQ